MASGVFESARHMAIAPGVTIKEQIESRGLSQKEFAVRLGLSEKHISRLINGRVELTPNVALRLESVLGVPAQFWLNLESLFREELARVEEENALQEDIELARKFPYTAMANLGWVTKARSYKEKVSALRRFFEVAQLETLNRLMIPGIAYRRLTQTEENDYALAAWSQKARLEAQNIPCGEINLNGLRSILSELRKMTLLPFTRFVPALREVLAKCGIALVILPHLGGSFLHGASFTENCKIVVGVTQRGKMADVFWFSLFHEIGHVLNGDIFSPEERDDEESERAADLFAQNVLIPEESYRGFTSNKNFNREQIVGFADSVGIAPFIVLGRLQKENHVQYNQYRDLKMQYEPLAI